MSASKSGQSSLEFMYAVVFILFLVVILISAAADQMADFKQEKDVFLVNDLAQSVKNEVSVAHSMSDGYVRGFDIPAQLEGEDYSISLSSGFVSVSFGSHSVSVAVQPVSGGLVKGSNVIRKVGGNVSLN
jgi:hypothetical protein